MQDGEAQRSAGPYGEPFSDGHVPQEAGALREHGRHAATEADRSADWPTMRTARTSVQVDARVAGLSARTVGTGLPPVDAHRDEARRDAATAYACGARGNRAGTGGAEMIPPTRQATRPRVKTSSVIVMVDPAPRKLTSLRRRIRDADTAPQSERIDHSPTDGTVDAGTARRRKASTGARAADRTSRSAGHVLPPMRACITQRGDRS